MQLKQTSVITGLLAGGLLAASSAPAQAFTFTTNTSVNNGPAGDIILDSVTLESGDIIDQFLLITEAEILFNQVNELNEAADGGASAEQGDDVTDGVSAENPDNGDIAAALGNLNLNSIIDTEDGKVNPDQRGAFEMNVFFESEVDQVYFWERGINSVLGVQAIDADGNVIGDFLELGASVLYDPGQFSFEDAGFAIDTKEIDEVQAVGSVGLDTWDFGVVGPIAGLRLVSDSAAGYNGADFKIIGAKVDNQSIPEPAALAGLGIVAGALVLSRRRLAH